MKKLSEQELVNLGKAFHENLVQASRTFNEFLLTKTDQQTAAGVVLSGSISYAGKMMTLLEENAIPYAVSDIIKCAAHFREQDREIEGKLIEN